MAVYIFQENDTGKPMDDKMNTNGLCLVLCKYARTPSDEEPCKSCLQGYEVVKIHTFPNYKER